MTASFIVNDSFVVDIFQVLKDDILNKEDMKHLKSICMSGGPSI